jgi:glycosyltransferase involved in cell wall biosynthesis
VTRRPLRVAIVADYCEEGWPSMDIVADMLVAHLRAEHAESVDATLIRPRMPFRLSRIAPGARSLDRVIARVADYPRSLARHRGRFDVYHIVDHSYAHLVHGLPADRVLVTCHDVDAFRSVLQPELEPRTWPYRMLARRILSGLCRAAHVACDSEATKSALIGLAGIPEGHVSVIPNGVDFRPPDDGDGAADLEAARMLGRKRGIELLHVGSTIPRKRIDVLLEVFAAVRRVRPDVRLTRVGGPFTAAQRVLARELGVLDAVTVLPFVDRATLAAVYRRSALVLLTSDREGFGLPVVEALASGTPMVVSDIPVLREIGGTSVVYCPVAVVEEWAAAILGLLDEREREPSAWDGRRRAGFTRAADFSWSRYTDAVVERYLGVARQAMRAGT